MNKVIVVGLLKDVAIMLLQLHNGALEGCRAIPKGYIVMDETDWYRLHMAPVVDKLPPSKTYLPFPGLLWGTPVVDLFGVDNEEAAKSLVAQKASATEKLWSVWKTPHHVHQVPPKRTKKGDTTRKRSRKGTKECAESDSEVTDTEKDDRSYIESEGEVTDKPDEDADVSESEVCETDDEYVYDSPFDSDDNEEHCEEDPPENAVDMEVDDTVDSDDE